jgi:hypothetical protein
MSRLALAIASFGAAVSIGCGGSVQPSRTLSVHQALTDSPELLEAESVAVRQELFRDAARISLTEAGREGDAPVLFPIIFGGGIYAAPALDPRADLLQPPDAGQPLALTFDGRARWPEERHEALQGLSEREVAELVARTLLGLWGLSDEGVVQVERASGAPYAVAYVDGILRINPAFLYLAAALTPGANLQPLQ